MKPAVFLLAALTTPAFADNDLGALAEALSAKVATDAAQPGSAPTVAADAPGEEPAVDLLADDAPTFERVELGPPPSDRTSARTRGRGAGDRVPIDFEGVDVSGELVKPQGPLGEPTDWVCGTYLLQQERWRREEARVERERARRENGR